MTWKEKSYIFSTFVESKLLYAASSLCLTVAPQRRVNGFQCRCIRKITGIPPAYLSRVSNKEVLHRAGHRPATELLRKKRLQLFGKVLRSPEGHPLRASCFMRGTTLPATDQYVRRIGRPCREWARELIADSCALFGNLVAAQEAALHKTTWSAALSQRLGF